MSLVSEALRKARREAAERGENLEGRTAQTTVIQVTRGPRTWQVVALGAVVALAAATLGAVAVWWLVGGAPGPEIADLGDRPAATGPVMPAATPTTAPEDRPDAAGATTPGSAATVTPTPRRRLLPPTPRTADAAPIADPSTTDDPRPTAVPEASTAERTDPTPAPSTETTALGPNEFLGEAVIDGRRLVLDYIAYLPTGAFAEINGAEVRLGSRIEGFTVESITATAVTLRGPDGRVVLRAR
jgi:hypothetical protein